MKATSADASIASVLRRYLTDLPEKEKAAAGGHGHGGGDMDY